MSEPLASECRAHLTVTFIRPPDCDIQLVALRVESGQPLAIGDGFELLDAGRHEVRENERQAHIEEKGVDAVDIEGGQDVLEGCG